MATERDRQIAAAGRKAALVMAGTALFWILATFAGGQMGLSHRTQALFDLMALAGFGLALWMTYQVWRLRRNDKG
jgi:threonine/homoserine/homoserine lactone efflux protein